MIRWITWCTYIHTTYTCRCWWSDRQHGVHTYILHTHVDVDDQIDSMVYIHTHLIYICWWWNRQHGLRTYIHTYSPFHKTLPKSNFKCTWFRLGLMKWALLHSHVDVQIDNSSTEFVLYPGSGEHRMSLMHTELLSSGMYRLV